MSWTVIQGGRTSAPPRVYRSYRLDTNAFGVTYVLFGYSPTSNVFDCVMPLDEAVARGFVAPPRTATLRVVGRGER
ncbi:MAG: hypothetical protein AB7H93_13315 [Vicinamibacterales bacterium]